MAEKSLWAVVHTWEGDVTVDIYTTKHLAQARAVSILFDRIEHGNPYWAYREFVELVGRGQISEALKYAKQSMKINEAIDVQNIGEVQDTRASASDVRGWMVAEAKRVLRGLDG